MKTVSAALLNHLAGSVTTIAHCLKLTRRDGVVMGFTDYTDDILFDGVTYEAGAGANLSALSGSSDLSVDNADITTVLDSEKITSADILAGLYSMAGWELFMLNYADLTMGKLDLSRGWIGEVDYGVVQCKAEARSLYDSLSQYIVELVSPDCQADLGDARCKIDLTSYTVTGAVGTVISDQAFTDATRGEADGWFTGGKLTWTSGANAGKAIEVKKFAAADKSFILFAPMPNAIQAGDQYSVYAGCDKTRDTCKAKFNNIVNFRGFPDLPGTKGLMQYEIPG